MDRTSSNANPTPAPSRATSISFCPAPHPAEPFKYGGLKAGKNESLPQALLREIAPTQNELCQELLHTSLSSDTNDILPNTNGFVDTVVEAYNRHRCLIIRPDDVWLSILTQFAFYVNGNAETLRSVFVAHEGKKELEVTVMGNRYSLDPAWMAHQMTKLMENHLVDEALREWVSPSFTTTTDVDKATCAMVMMGMMKEYFSFKVCCMCGIPKVTLEGERKDWEDILVRLERLKKYGVQPTAWYHLLRPILSRFVAAYDDPNSRKNLDFWNKVVHEKSLGSGSPLLSGWITAFCMFDAKGRWQGDEFDEERLGKSNETKDYLEMSASKFAAAYFTASRNSPYLKLDGFPYPTIDTNQIPCGYTHVDIKLDDNGESLDTMLVAGLIGSRICSISGKKNMGAGTRNAVRPLSGWWYFVKGEQPTDMFEGERSPSPLSDQVHDLPVEQNESRKDSRRSFLSGMFKGHSLFSSIRRK